MLLDTLFLTFSCLTFVYNILINLICLVSLPSLGWDTIMAVLISLFVYSHFLACFGLCMSVHSPKFEVKALYAIVFRGAIKPYMFTINHEEFLSRSISIQKDSNATSNVGVDEPGLSYEMKSRKPSAKMLEQPKKNGRFVYELLTKITSWHDD